MGLEYNPWCIFRWMQTHGSNSTEMRLKDKSKKKISVHTGQEREKSQMTFLVRRSDQVETSGLAGLPAALQRPAYAVASDEPSRGRWLAEWGKVGEAKSPHCFRPQHRSEERGWIPAHLGSSSVGGRASVSEKLFRDRALGPTWASYQQVCLGQVIELRIAIPWSI